MRHTLMLNLDEKHARLLEELRLHFKLSAEDTARFAIRLTHARCKQKPDVLVPEFKPRSRPSRPEPEDNAPC
ncbi:hypothetical protein FDP22_04385 [Paroceanicella profunda]|uniref:Uncharacterized protein n=1 Tax=Paroceanicella profunda TaxID=2579971 RepID=A0A5B8FVE6_9RHOB|nr:hypothetical protein [Paroceanicella profunda]QDL91090.1 hypothetical protein FDP22_04385 [Paroceanicella profunda]